MAWKRYGRLWPESPALQRFETGACAIEEFAPAFTAEWGPTLRRLEAVPEARFVPGHGLAVDRAFVATQAQAFEQVSAACAAADSPEAALDALPASARAVLGGQARPAVERYYTTIEGG